MDPAIQKLVQAAKEASKAAYAPYSHFPVGAAVLTGQSRSYSGCNVENASFGLTICAERNAIFQAVAAGDRAIKAIAIYTPTKEPTAPCGAYRQVLFEFSKTCRVICCSDGEKVIDTTIDKLLPLAFGPDNL